ncbi:oligosaccharyl transferase STT3 subunit [Teladorsagia circumcincta]|uniref:dolichyl-diphosphooligosaccharide--protein glycotransferase n=1 Tax=Teladorsagia circumcincta TaxID=45464 RepID=A0A2G9UJL5_TELCI|nr:oligosaccharyl transferase STT3 subunit [Teladorsagia circumcincta]
MSEEDRYHLTEHEYPAQDKQGCHTWHILMPFCKRKANDSSKGKPCLFAACFIAISPGYTSRSVAGSYDNEGIAIFALQGQLLICAFKGRYSSRLFVAYTTFYCLATVLSMQIPFVGFQPVRTSEHMPAFGVFGLLQIVAAMQYARQRVSRQQFMTLFVGGLTAVGCLAFVVYFALVWGGYVAPFSGRFYSLWDTGYAKIHIPIIASVSEHQPTTWVSFFFDLQITAAVFPVGVWYCVKNVNDERVFIILYAVTAVYFAGVMVRLMLTLTPAVCVLSGIAFSYTFENDRIIMDDFREAYHWLSENTADDARIMSWWDYGYQIAGMANRTTLVDNNTWNNSHIALVGKAMSSSEPVAYEIMRELDVDYVLVIFGGVIGYSGDDINKFLWMVRIAEGEHPKEIKEANYFTESGEYSVGAQASETMLNCLMYKMSYYRFADVKMGYNQEGFDRTRGYVIGKKDITLEYIEEAFTSENWLVRIYKVKHPENRPVIKRNERQIVVDTKKVSKKSIRSVFRLSNQDGLGGQVGKPCFHFQLLEVRRPKYVLTDETGKVGNFPVSFKNMMSSSTETVSFEKYKYEELSKGSNL